MKSQVHTVIYAALAANLLIAVTKFLAAWWTGSSAILSEGVHSLVDGGNQVLLLHGQRRAALPPDQDFPFGHGKEIYFWSFVVALLVFALGAGVSLVRGCRPSAAPCQDAKRAGELPGSGGGYRFRGYLLGHFAAGVP